MDGVRNTDSEELIERENYVREHIVASSEIQYVDSSEIPYSDGSIVERLGYEYDAAGNQIKETYYSVGSGVSFLEYEYDTADG